MEEWVMSLPTGFARTAVLMLALLATSCTATVYEVDTRPPLRPGPPPPDRFCTREYAPVCGRRGGSQRTFANDCEADVAGYRIAYDGQCRFGPPPGPPLTPRPPRPQPGPADRFCTRDYAPVCARRGDRVRTFGNSCEADVAGFRVIDRGPC
jgi:hypothetical protein